MKLHNFFICLCIGLCAACTTETPLFEQEHLSASDWVVEQQPGGKVNFSEAVIEITDAKGCTLWLKHKLSGAIKIEYDVTVIDEGGPHDRVSDLNCFWMANDPKNQNDFFEKSQLRAGKFPNYHELLQYYVGYGGHDNTKTRFRRYDGNFERPLLPEHDLNDPKYSITANTNIHITLIANNNSIIYKRDGEKVFEIYDEEPYTSGYFGFRTVNNHMKIKNFKVSKIN